MTYRDELDAAKSRIAELERELEKSEQEKLALAKIQTSTQFALAKRDAAGLASTKGMMNIPEALQRVIDFEGVLPEAAYKPLLQAIEQRCGNGTIEILAGYLRWSAKRTPDDTQLRVTISAENNRTKLVVEQSGRGRALALAGLWGGLGAGAGGIAGALSLIALPAVGAIAIGGAVVTACLVMARASNRGRAEIEAEEFEKVVEYLGAKIREFLHAAETDG